MISKSLEEYLKTMYVLKKQNSQIRVTDIANKMNLTKPSVNKALNNLKANNLIIYEPYSEIEFTKEGEELAKKILAAFDIVYLFLSEVLELKDDKEQIMNEAKNIKSVISDKTLNQLARFTHKELKLEEIECCGYDINKEKCRNCLKLKSDKLN